MDDSSGDFREFRVEVPERNIEATPRALWDRFVKAMRIEPDDEAARLWDWGYEEEMMEKYAVLVTGRAHPLVISGLMALAQGHDLEVICEKIEALV